MKIIEAHLRRCLEEHIIIDKKMRKRSYRYPLFIIPLSDQQPFDADESVMIMQC